MKNRLFIALALLCLVFVGCRKPKPPVPDKPKFEESGIYLTIFAFNDGIKYTKDFTLVDEKSSNEMKQWIMQLEQGNGTSLFYAIDNALDSYNSVLFPDNLNNVSMVTFTDGIDISSCGWNSNYSSRQEYQAAIKSRIVSERFHDFLVDAYGVGVPSSDIGNQIAEFNGTIRDISSSDANANVLTNFGDINEVFSSIASDITTYSTSHEVSFEISYGGQDDVCLIFDGKPIEQSQCKIKGTLNSQRDLINIEYTGLVSNNGDMVFGKKIENSSYSIYTFQGMTKTNGDILSDNEILNAKLYRSSLGWGLDSEFDPASAISTEIIKKTAAIALVLDISSSLGSNLEAVKVAACSFVDNLIPPKQYCSVIFKLNGGIGFPPATQRVEQGHNITLPQQAGFSRPGYTFTGWNTNAEGTGMHFNPGDVMMVTNNFVLYAEWK